MKPSKLILCSICIAGYPSDAIVGCVIYKMTSTISFGDILVRGIRSTVSQHTSASLTLKNCKKTFSTDSLRRGRTLKSDKMPKYSYHTIAHKTLAPARFEWMASQAEAAKIDLNFFPWVTVDDIKDVPHQYSEAASRWRHGRAMKPTELACSLSHLQLWRQLLNSTDDYYIIFEDDMAFEPNLDEIVRSCFTYRKARLIKLSALEHKPYRYDVIDTLPTGHQFIRFKKVPYSAGAYIISRSAAETMIPYCEKIHVAMDAMMCRTWNHKVASYGVYPLPAIHAPQFESAVGDRPLQRDHDNPFIKGYSRICRMTDSVRRRVLNRAS